MNPHRKAARIPPVVNELHSSVAEAFCLTRGGPLYRLQLRLDAAKDERTQVVRRALAATLLTWLPLLPLTLGNGKRLFPNGVHAKYALTPATPYPSGVVGLYHGRHQ